MYICMVYEIIIRNFGRFKIMKLIHHNRGFVALNIESYSNIKTVLRNSLASILQSETILYDNVIAVSKG
jgi:hypothetical protein